MKFDEKKIVLLSTESAIFKLNPLLKVYLNDTPILPWRYLGHMILNDLNNNEYINRQLKYFTEGQTRCYVPSELHIPWIYFCLCPIVEICPTEVFSLKIPKDSNIKQKRTVISFREICRLWQTFQCQQRLGRNQCCWFWGSNKKVDLWVPWKARWLINIWSLD